MLTYEFLVYCIFIKMLCHYFYYTFYEIIFHKIVLIGMIETVIKDHQINGLDG